MVTHIMMDIMAISTGYSESTKITPMMYHITPFVCFYKIRKGGRCQTTIATEQMQKMTYLFALAHEKAEYFFIVALERWVIKSNDIAGDDNKQSARKHDYDTFR